VILAVATLSSSTRGESSFLSDRLKFQILRFGAPLWPRLAGRVNLGSAVTRVTMQLQGRLLLRN
jgi:hypothetical protein